MTFIVAALEHATRTFLAALAERCSGPAGYEDSDYLKLDVDKCSYCPVDDGTSCTLSCDCERRAYFRQDLVEREAEEEVAEPMVDCDDCGKVNPFDRLMCNYNLCGKSQSPATTEGDAESDPAGVSADPTPAPPVGRLEPWLENLLSVCAAIEAVLPDPSSTTPSASQPPVDDRRPGGLRHSPVARQAGTPTPAADAGSAESDSPEVSAPTAPSGEQGTPGQFAALAVREVLAGVVRCGRGEICIEDSRTDSWSVDDWYDWREYVAAEVRRRIDVAKTVAPQFIETGHDMGATAACETFPQYRKRS